MSSRVNPFSNLLTNVTIDGTQYRYYDISSLGPHKYKRLPFSIRVLLESAVRSCDGFQIKETDVQKIIDWETQQKSSAEIPFKPSRVLLQDLTGVPAVVDFAAMREAFQRLGGDPVKINPLCPADLVIDHSVQVDFSRTLLGLTPKPSQSIKSLCDDCAGSGQCAIAQALSNNSVPLRGGIPPAPDLESWQPFRPLSPLRLERPDRPDTQNKSVINKISENKSNNVINPYADTKLKHKTCPFHRLKSLGAEALQRNEELEFERNKERFEFLKWGATAFKNTTIIPPGSGICHQVNLEYLARVVFTDEHNILYPDSVVGLDSHTTMINGLGVVGWGVGGIEAEAVMLGQSICMVLPQVVGYKLIGSLPSYATSTDAVLTITKNLRQMGVVGKFVEFFGPGVSHLSIADRATIANMCPEYGATIGFFPTDNTTFDYLVQTGREDSAIKLSETYLKAVKMFRNDYNDSTEDPVFSQVLELDLSSITPSVSGPKRPHDRVAVADMKKDFQSCLTNKVGFKGFGLSSDKLNTNIPIVFNGKEHILSHGSVVIAAITSCTNTSNPSVMLGAGLLCKKAVERGLSVAPYVKTSMSPGSGVVTFYLRESGVTPYLEKLGFDIVGYGCMTCIGNSGPLPEEVVEAIEKGDLISVGVLSGNRNFEGRVHPNTRANYLASPLLVVAYAIAGTVNIDFEVEPLGKDAAGKDVFLRDLWPTRDEIHAIEQKCVIPAMFKEVYSKIRFGNKRWNDLKSVDDLLYRFDPNSTYIKSPPYFDKMQKTLPKIEPILNARVLLNLGDSVTTDHISPAGSIARNSPAAKYLMERGIPPSQFNSYGSRRGNDAIMTRGTFANIRLVNKFLAKPGPNTLHIPSGKELSVFDAAQIYREEGIPLIIITGKDYGSGSSRDWAAKGPHLLGVRAVIAESYERIHRSNLIGMGIIPLEFISGQNSESLGLTGHELYSIDVPENMGTRHRTTIRLNNGKSFDAIMRFDTEVELEYFRNGGILHYMLRQLLHS